VTGQNGKWNNFREDKNYPVISVNYKRRKTVEVNIGGIPLGSEFPVRVQSMANTLTSDIQGSVNQCIDIINAGADYVRFTVPAPSDVENFAMIRKDLRAKGFQTPLIADVHFNADIALQVSEYADKVRINPGNFGEPAVARARFIALVEKCRTRGVALRIGVNHGSLSRRIMEEYGDTPAGMAESAMEFLRICRILNFDQVVVSMKASNVRVMVQATRLVVHKMEAEDMHFPLHLGVTEAGEGEDGRIKSAAGIGILLCSGLGDTIRVSLTEAPEQEIPVAVKLLRHIENVKKHEPLPSIEMLPADPFDFTRRISAVRGKIGGSQVPVVIGETDMADYAISRQGIADAASFINSSPASSRLNFVRFTPADIKLLERKDFCDDPSVVIVYDCTSANVQAELTWLHSHLKQMTCTLPVIIHRHYDEDDLETLQVKSANDLGAPFIDGFGDGLWITNSGSLSEENLVSTSFGILQACRARMTHTEFISCPSCGRTNFNLIETMGRIKSATSHLKSLKIGVMGCIVNGPGEMADADYGYVGAGKGKITLYKAKEIVKRGIPEQLAVDELVALIKEYGDWEDPKS
jgi:(E)-4-hydroxy-3-methylbut-2-enyl-diphosphate synthase